MLIDLVWFFAGMAIMKGLIEPIITTQTRRFVKKYVPLLLDRLDPFMPRFISYMSPEDLRGVIFQNLLEIDPRLTPRQQEQILNQLRREYDPIVNAQKLRDGSIN